MKTLTATIGTIVVLWAVAAFSVATASPPTYTQPDPIGTGRLKQCPPPWHFLEPGLGGCVWDGRHYDDPGLPKRSFMVTPNGKVIFLPHYAAHVLLYGNDAGPAEEPTVEPTELETAVVP